MNLSTTEMSDSVASHEMDMLVEKVSCDLCGGNESSPLLSAHDINWEFHSEREAPYTPNATWTVVACSECGFVYLNPRPKLAVLKHFYPTDYFPYRVRGVKEDKKLRQSIKKWMRRSRTLYQLCSRVGVLSGITDQVVDEAGWMSPGKVLDIGCGAGDFLDELRALDWETFGVDFEPRAVEIAQARGHKMWLGDITELRMPEQSMDAVWMSHILEHTPSPTRTLRAVHRVLRNDGPVIIEVPNFGSMWTAVFRKYSSGLDLPRHFYHFTENSLVRCLETCGFRVESVRTPANPRYILRSITLSTRRADVRLRRCWKDDDWSGLSETPPMLDLLDGFCRELECIGQGNNLRIVGRKISTDD